MALPPLAPGLLTLHSHRAENLLETVVAWLARHPLGPLEEEVVVVQSNAVAEWLKMALAQRLGVCAATRVELPGRLLWRISRDVLGRHRVPTELPLDKVPLTWRLMQALPELAADPALAALLPLPTGDDERVLCRRFQACQRLADVFDQYQVYRPDWLDDWAEGRAVLRTARGDAVPVPPDQAWQPVLWRHLVQALTPAQQDVLRPRLQRALLQRLAQTPPAPDGHAPALPVPRRVVVFGMGHLPPGGLALMGALARHSQVLLAVSNPCQYHWSDIIDGRELLRQAAPRRPTKGGRDLATVPLDDMHAHAHPLLAAWGRQARDAIRLLDLWTEGAPALPGVPSASSVHALAHSPAYLPVHSPAHHAAGSSDNPGFTPMPWARIDRFDDPLPAEPRAPVPLLLQVQRRIRDLVPLAEHAAQPDHGWVPEDRSIVFHVAHSPVRELEVLHDHLLALLAHPAPDGGQGAASSSASAPEVSPPPPGHTPLAGLCPRDIVVMVPDLAVFAPAIAAVFGQFPRSDPRFIPFDVADLGVERQSPLVAVWSWLWNLPHQRATHTEWQTLLDLPAVQARFDLPADEVPRLARWMGRAGVRWGLHAAHRDRLGLGPCGDDQTVHFGLSRLLAGVWVGEAADALGHVTPATDATGLDARLLGGLAHLLDAVDAWWLEATQPAPPAEWLARGRRLMARLFDPAQAPSDATPDAPPPRRRASPSPADEAGLAALRQAGERWLAACDQAGFDAPIDLDTARTAWMAALQPAPLDTRFQAGGVTFCTLLPLRTVPFRVVCLLGMNEGDYPRRAPQSDLDLMALPGQARPGDRSRRDDDRQLMLDALLSARDHLVISWCGRSVRDHSPQPPSVLVAQLRDHLAAGWGDAVLQALTVEHPLQPFSRRYFEANSASPHWFTHAQEWRPACSENTEQQNQYSRAPGPFFIQNFVAEGGPGRGGADAPLTLADLADALAHPARAFMRQRLGVHWANGPDGLPPDDEPFALEGLDLHRLLADALARLPANTPPRDAPAWLQRWLHRTARSGALPLGVAGQAAQDQLLVPLTRLMHAWAACRDAFPQPAPRLWCHVDDGATVLADGLDGLWQRPPGDPVWPASPALDAAPALALAQRLRVHVSVQRVLAPARLSHTSRPGAAPRGGPASVARLHRPHRWLGEWVNSLALCAHAERPEWAHTLVIGRDACLHLRPVPAAAARDQLLRLLAAWRDLLSQPLPLPWATAWAAVQARGDGASPDGDGNGHPSADASARAVYEGDHQQSGEGADPYWARTFPDFECLTQHPLWPQVAQTLVQPFHDWVSQQVDVWPHPDPEPDSEPDAEPDPDTHRNANANPNANAKPNVNREPAWGPHALGSRPAVGSLGAPEAAP